MSAFGVMLREMREARAMSQAELGRRMDMGSGYISRVEAGKREPSREFVNAAIAALSLNAGERRALRFAAGMALPDDAVSVLSCPHCGEAVELVKGAA